jgi:hypothetical protein
MATAGERGWETRMHTLGVRRGVRDVATIATMWAQSKT